MTGQLVRISSVVFAALFVGSLTSCSYELPETRSYIGPARPPISLEAPLPSSQPAASQPESLVEMIPPTGPIKITVTEALLLAIRNNQALVVQQFNPAIAKTLEEQQRAAFDPDVTAQYFYARQRGAGAETASQNASVGVTEFLPTGTALALTGKTTLDEDPTAIRTAATRLGLSATQSMLKGFGLKVNLASLRQAKLDTLNSEYLLRGFAESLVGSVEQSYWNYALAQRQIDIVQKSLELAEQQLADTKVRIEFKKVAAIEQVAAEAAVALAKEDLINARSNLATTRLQLLRLINPASTDLWTRDIVIQSLPAIPEIKLDSVEAHVALAMVRRPDLNEARLEIERGDLQIVKTRNGLLPKLDLFMTLGKTGYASSFGGSVSNLDGKGYDFQLGVNYELPPINRSARASDQNARLSRQQSEESLGNLIQLAEVDVRSAYIEVNRAYEQIAATAVSRKLQEANYKAEVEKFTVGKSTTFLVSQAQRDLVTAQVAEVQAVVAFLNAFVNLYQVEGSLLDRRGISCPAAEPVATPPSMVGRGSRTPTAVAP